MVIDLHTSETEDSFPWCVVSCYFEGQPATEDLSSVVIQKSLSFICHSGLDPESSVSDLDSRLRGNDGLGINVQKR